MITIGFDIDDVLRDFTGVLDNIIDKYYPNKINKNGPWTWMFDQYLFEMDELRKIWEEEYSKAILLEAPLCKNAYEGYKLIYDWAKNRGDNVICISNQSTKTLPYTLEWLGKNKFIFDKYIFTPNKHLIDMDYLIDDSPKYYDDWICSGKPKSNFILMNKSYNMQLYHTNRANDLFEAYTIILKLIKEEYDEN